MAPFDRSFKVSIFLVGKKVTFVINYLRIRYFKKLNCNLKFVNNIYIIQQSTKQQEHLSFTSQAQPQNSK